MNVIQYLRDNLPTKIHLPFHVQRFEQFDYIVVVVRNPLFDERNAG
jgi:hypothetical protein